MPMIDTDTTEGKAELQKLIDAETSGLKKKNEELLGDLKKVKESTKDIQTQLDELKTAKETAENEAAEKSGDIEKLKASLEAKFTKERDTLAAERDASNATVHKLLVENGLNDALTKAGVVPHHMDAVKALIMTQHKPAVVEVDGAPVARVGDDNIGDFVTKWAQGDQGKHYIAATANSGGGAGGSNGGGGAPVKGDMGGDRNARTAAIAAKFPDLQK